MKKFWNWTVNNDTGQRELWLDGVIAEDSWWGDEVTPAMFKSELNAGNGPVLLHINSPGGDCVAASQIYTMLMDYPFDIIVQIDSLAASAASVIAMAGVTVKMSPTALMMVHNPWTSAVGDAEEMKKAISLLDEVKESIINAYQIKTGLSRKELSDIMNAETWMNAHKAKEMGFCDEVLYEDEENPDEKPDFMFSAKTAEFALMNKVLASMPKAAIEPGATAPSAQLQIDSATVSNSIVEASADALSVNASSITGGVTTITNSGAIVATATTMPYFRIDTTPAVLVSDRGIVSNPETEPEQPNEPAPAQDNRVKAADLEKRLSLLK